ncbi:2-keto-4-pentenoate hydratase [Amycolatopsis sp. 195334CR]|uniref:2-keto-4-pentenoate hydratase n=1 Tax=Amycolatopsis sp. 195334CR TaxID=2814588 RepID=UPI001A8D78FA|nr:fumarylacetoacetate hydrolase family protein [Amycolatopsis sp. 195334CR]MBN6038818.1 fumarylacetoacetate hydrolase family protein [Amycolatopsis sp. 195334CR]
MTAVQEATQDTVDSLARRLDDAWENRVSVPPLSESEGLVSAELAYRIQTRWSELRQAEHGDRVIGRKIGLTSLAMQQQMGVDEPDYGSLWSSRHFPATAGRATLPSAVFLQPRAEGELAFLIGRPLSGWPITTQDVLAATDAVAASIEVIDSRITDFRIALTDTVADNASYGAVVLGPWSTALRSADLRTIGMLIHRNGEPVVHSAGAAALGNPARSVAWLARRLDQLGTPLAPGDIVLSGSLGPSLPVGEGDVFTVETHGLPPLFALFS